MQDLVLTYDFALKREVETMGGKACYVDHIVDPREMQQNNFLAYEFFRNWHRDGAGRDLFEYCGISFGFALRLYYWSEYLFYVRARLCLGQLRTLRFDKLFAGTRLGMIESVLEDMSISFTPVFPEAATNHCAYYFPIHEWMNENIGRRGTKANVASILTHLTGVLLSWVDRAGGNRRTLPMVFVQNYHPTTGIIKRLTQERKVRVLGVTIAKTALRTLRNSRYLPLWGSARSFDAKADEIMRRFRSTRHARLILSNGEDITDGAYSVIDRQIAGRMAETLRSLKCVIHYLDRNPIQLQVMISNVGETSALIDSVCRARGIPGFLIINGWLSGAFLDEGKYATTINAYAPSIKENYFRAMENVVCLGDPRMDGYPPVSRALGVGKSAVEIAVGASGYNNIDLNSYVAVEFEFMFDVLQALQAVKRQGKNLRITIKVRPNGYIEQYRRFSEEYFPGLVDVIVDRAPMREVLEKADFYISIYSQTIFEASCLGVPCIYYKKDDEILDPPFDGKSELVTADSVEDLTAAILGFFAGSSRFDAFLCRSVMEKYIGPLDGENLSRNLDYIYSLLKQGSSQADA